MKISYTLEKIEDSILHVRFATRLQMSRTLCRLQEFYENPDLRGKVFMREDLISWAAKFYGKTDKTFNYFTSWDGFNFPMENALNFLNTYPAEKRIYDEENEILRVLLRQSYKIRYVVFTSKGSHLTTLRHELAHAYFYTSPSYAASARNIIGNYDVRKQLKQLKVMGYHDDVLLDEINAYMIDGSAEETNLSEELKVLYDNRESKEHT